MYILYDRTVRIAIKVIIPKMWLDLCEAFIGPRQDICLPFTLTTSIPKHPFLSIFISLSFSPLTLFMSHVYEIFFLSNTIKIYVYISISTVSLACVSNAENLKIFRRLKRIEEFI